VKTAWTGALLSLSLCADLGLVNVTILRTAIRQGATPALLLGVGSCFGDTVYFLLAVFGISALPAWAPLRWTLWLAGTGILLVLAWRMIREVIHPRALNLEDALDNNGAAPLAMLSMGAGLALASPTAILWFAAIGGSVIASFGGDRNTLWPFAGGFFGGALLWSAVFACAAAGLARMLGATLVRILSFVSALLFLYFAGTVFVNGVGQFI